MIKRLVNNIDYIIIITNYYYYLQHGLEMCKIKSLKIQEFVAIVPGLVCKFV